EDERARGRSGRPQQEPERDVVRDVVHLPDKEDRRAEQEAAEEANRFADARVRPGQPVAAEERRGDRGEQHGEARGLRDPAPVGGEEEDHAGADGARAEQRERGEEPAATLRLRVASYTRTKRRRLLL